MSRRSVIMVQKTYYQIGLVTLLSVLLWVSITVYQAIVGSVDVGVDPALLAPVTSTIDAAVVASISGRTQMASTAAEMVKSLPAPLASGAPVATPKAKVEKIATVSATKSAVASTSAETTTPTP